MTNLEVVAFKSQETLRFNMQVEREALVEKIDALLPQTQCRKCHYPECRPYAEAIASGEADINQCPPGGEHGIRALASLLGREYKPLSPLHGVESPKTVAIIEEEICIGCTLCIQACPVDAIVGAAKQMHTIIADHCTGCELCLPPCPVDCIRMEPDIRQFEEEAADAARERYKFHQFREARDAEEKANRLFKHGRTTQDRLQKDAEENDVSIGVPAVDSKKALIAAAIARARMQQTKSSPKNTTQLTSEQQAQIAAIEAHRQASMKSSISKPADDTP